MKQPHDSSSPAPVQRERWGSRIGVIFAVMGSAIGLGNFIRFPGLAAQFGGGHFMIPYVIAFLLLGLPIAWAEWSMGRLGGRRGHSSSPGIFYVLWENRASPYFGVLGLIIPIGIYMYYVYIEAWCLYYAYKYLTGGISLGQDPDAYVQFFANFTGMAQDGAIFALQDGSPAPALVFLAICFTLNFIVIYLGLSRGIELVSKIAIPVLFVCAIGVLIRVLTLGTPDPALPERDVLNGLGYMWNPTLDWATLSPVSNSGMWLAAAGQIFFSLSVGFGIIITYASYVDQREDVILSGTTSAAGNIFAEVALGGMITIPAAFIFLGPGFGTGTFSLGFFTLPNVFANMQFGAVAGFLWFFLLFVAALTSSLSMLQPAIAFLEEGLGLHRKASVTFLGLLTLCGTMFIAYFSQDVKALDLMDFWIGQFLIYILATVLIILFGWGVGVDRGLAEAHKGSLMTVPRIFRFIIKYVSPVYLILVFIFFMLDKENGIRKYIGEMQTNAAAFFTVVFIVVMSIFLTLLVSAAVRRWQRMNVQRGLDGGEE